MITCDDATFEYKVHRYIQPGDKLLLDKDKVLAEAPNRRQKVIHYHPQRCSNYCQPKYWSKAFPKDTEFDLRNLADK